jgi:hypothetical protein
MSVEPGKRRKLKRKQRDVQPAEVRYPELDNMLYRLAELKAEGVAFTDRHKTEFLPLEAKAMAFMQEHGITVYQSDLVTGDMRGSSTTVLDWNGLQKEVPKSAWLSLLDPPQPSLDKLKAAVELGLIDAELVKKHTTTEPRKSYILPTFRKQAG